VVFVDVFNGQLGICCSSNICNYNLYNIRPKMAENEMKILDGRKVFDLVTERGLPLEIIALQCRTKNLTIDWYKLIWSMYGANWSKNRIRNSIFEASNCFPYSDEIKKKSDMIINSLNFEDEKNKSKISDSGRKCINTKRGRRSVRKSGKHSKHPRVLSKFMRERGWRILSGRISYRKNSVHLSSKTN
jgi:hypothetical protein